MSFFEKEFLHKQEKTPLLQKQVWARNELDEFLGDRAREHTRWTIFLGVTALSIVIFLGVVGIFLRLSSDYYNNPAIQPTQSPIIQNVTSSPMSLITDAANIVMPSGATV